MSFKVALFYILLSERSQKVRSLFCDRRKMFKLHFHRRLRLGNFAR